MTGSASSRVRWQLLLLVCANLLTSIGGGRLLSASKGVTGLLLFGSGSILAFLAGSSLGLVVLLALRRHPLGRALATVSSASMACSLSLVVIVQLGAQSSQAVLAGPLALLFWLVLVVRCAFWYASRSLRSNVAATVHSSFLALAESSYFLGFIIGLLLGPVSVFGFVGLPGALALDILLLMVVVGADLLIWRTLISTNLPASSHRGEKTPRASWQNQSSFWRLTWAFSLATIACQVVIFHFADAHPAWAEAVLATFYVGVSAAAAFCSWANPTLQVHARGFPELRLSARKGQPITIPLALLIPTIGGLIAIGIATSNLVSEARFWPGLLLIGIGSGLFELMVIALVGRIGSGRTGGVAQAFGVAATAATVALFLMGLAALGVYGSLLVSALGLSCAYLLVVPVRVDGALVDD